MRLMLLGWMMLLVANEMVVSRRAGDKIVDDGVAADKIAAVDGSTGCVQGAFTNKKNDKEPKNKKKTLDNVESES